MKMGAISLTNFSDVALVFHLSIETNVHKGPVEWLEPVLEEEYNKLK